ncbi:hypothetical protein FRB94_004954 [Tulasnella sp. JGI-2019a]|nr:hypothetical protein FRB93_005767 [Tulasnella sp. JGI-2019a]KAG9001022.1 hypothetical protein FRB94_004954 [Tulasnella sp. JGI-2019a]
MADIPLDVAHFLGLIVAVGLYGMPLASPTKPERFSSHPRSHRTKFVLTVTLCLFVITTVNIGIFIAVNYSAFITHRENLGVEAYFGTVWSLIIPLQSAVLSRVFLALAVFTSDTLLLWRLHAVWSRNWWVIAVPAAFLAVEAALSITLCTMAALQTGSVNATIACSVATAMVNVISTPLIAGRLWWLGGRNGPRGTRSLYKTIVVRLVESGSLYTVTLLVYMGFNFTPQYLGVATFLTYVFTLVVTIAPLLLILQLDTSIASEMHVVDPDRRSKDDLASPPQRSVGLVSTTIAFNRQPPTSSFGLQQQLDSRITQTDSGMTVGSCQEKVIDQGAAPDVDIMPAGASCEQEGPEDVRESKHDDEEMTQTPLDLSFGLLYRIA